MTPPQPIIDKLYNEFTMPGLSKYRFNIMGEVYSKRSSIKSSKGISYLLWLDNGRKEYIPISEIIQYGKHIKSLQQYCSGGLELRLQSRVNKME